MYLTRLSKSHVLRMLFPFFLVTLLAACGTGNTTTSAHPETPQASVTANEPTATSIPSYTPTLSYTPTDSFNPDTSALNAANVTEDGGSLRIQSTDGFQCPYGVIQHNLNFPMDQLVLSSDRTTYSQDEIGQMRDYLDFYQNPNYSAMNFLKSGTQPPSTLRWVSAGSIDPIPGTDPVEASDPPCGTTLTLTNTGSTPIQIPQAGVQLEAPPQQNPYTYRLIDACTIIPPSQQTGTGGCLPSFGHAGSCGMYTASVQLGQGEQNSEFTAVPSEPGCNTLTIPPTAQIDLNFAFSLAPNIHKNIIYSIVPKLTLGTANGEQTVLLSQFTSTLTFASANQFSCYGLQGTMLVLEPSPIFSNTYTSTGENHHWCM